MKRRSAVTAASAEPPIASIARRTSVRPNPQCRPPALRAASAR